MEQDRRQYKLVRLLTGGVTPVLLAAALLAFARWHEPSWEAGAQAAGICRELIAGTTEGRQALFGSCWVAPLPVLVYLPFAWLLPEPAAGWAVFFATWLFAFWAVREAVKSIGQSAWRIVLPQVAIAGVAAFSGLPTAFEAATALIAGLLLVAAGGVADWAAYRRLRDVVAAGAAAALLALCGFPLFALAALAALLLPLAVFGAEEARGRAPAWLLLGGLPLVYALGSWLLMNRLVLGDPLFFLRSLEHVVPHAWRLLAVFGAAAATMAPALLMIASCDRKGATESRRRAVGVAVVFSFAGAVVACWRLLAAFGVAWSAGALAIGALALVLIAFARLRRSAVCVAATLALLVLVCASGLGRARAKPEATRAGETREALCRDVEEYVDEQTPYGRVFVLGYAGLDLLRGYAGERLVANLDLHVGALRRAYKGQDLYVLVPEPAGATRAESVFWRYPEIYTRGCERLLFAETFGTWHLFEVVTAPTQEQLDEWKRAR